jgi:hypothetical protein
MAETRRASNADIEAMDEEELAHFGYKQELKRDWGLLHNFGISFSIIVSCAEVYSQRTMLISYASLSSLA